MSPASSCFEMRESSFLFFDTPGDAGDKQFGVIGLIRIDETKVSGFRRGSRKSPLWQRRNASPTQDPASQMRASKAYPHRPSGRRRSDRGGGPKPSKTASRLHRVPWVRDRGMYKRGGYLQLPPPMRTRLGRQFP